MTNRSAPRLLYSLATLALVLVTARVAPAKAVLFAPQGRPWISQLADPAVKADLERDGWQVGTTEIGDLTWELLRQFNVVVLYRMPAEVPQDGGPGRGTVLDAKAPLLERFVRAGGGLLLLHDESYDQTFATENRFLRPFGAEILNEQVTDPEHSWRQPEFLQYWFAWTTDVTAGHPVTAGVRTLWYPEGYSQRDDRRTCALKLGDDWAALARAMPSAYSWRGASGTGAGTAGQHRTIASAPALLGARSWGDGRLVVFASHSTFTLQAGRHTIWQDIVLSRGDGRRPSDTGRMLFNALGWLAEPTKDGKDGKALGGFREPPGKPAGPDPVPDYVPDRQPALQAHTFRGMIGAHSALSDGQGSVAEWAEAAKDRGLDFLVFTESFPPLNEAGWGRLREECRRASDGRFLCVPGIDYRDAVGNRYAGFAFRSWPKQEWLDKSGGRIGDTPGLYFGEDWPPLAVIDAGHNPSAPWFLKFFGGFAVESYRTEGGKPTRTDDAMPQYLRLMANQYNSVPVAFHDLRRPADLAGAGGFLDCAWAEKLEDVPKSYKHGWYAQPQSAYLSEGPKLDAWWIDNGWADFGQTDRAPLPWSLHVRISSDAPLRQVTIYDGRGVFRRFAVDGNRFSTILTGFHDCQRYFVAAAEDASGRRLVSPTLRTADSRHAIYMCTDMQNTIEAGVARDRDGHWQAVQMMGNYVTGWDGLQPGILVPESQLMPEGLDYVVKGFNGGASHSFVTKQGRESALAARDMVFGSGDCTILDNDFSQVYVRGGGVAPTKLADTRARYLSFTQRLYGHNLLLIERETTLQQDLSPDPGVAPDLQMLNVSGPDESFPDLTFVTPDATPEGHTVVGRRPGPEATAEQDRPILTGGYAALYPDFYGSAGVFPLRSEIGTPGGKWADEPLHLHVRGATMLLGYQLPGRTLPAGTKLRQTLLLMRAKFGDRGAECFADVRRQYGLADGRPAYDVNAVRGAVTGTRYTLDLKAEGGAAVVEINRSSIPSDVPVRVAGLHDNWSAVWAELPADDKAGEGRDAPSIDWRPVGTLDGTGYLGVDINDRGRRLFIGHPVTCDHEALTLNLAAWGGDGLTVEVHNASAQAVSARVRLHPRLGPTTRDVTVSPGASGTVRLPWR